MSDKSFNIVSAELLDLVKSGWGITQAMRKVGINNSELLVCLNKNAELAAACENRFGIQANGTGIKTDVEEDELAALRAKAETLGIKVHPQMGLKKLRKLVDDAESEPAPITPVPGAQPDTPIEPKTSENQGLDSKNNDGNGADINTAAE